MLDDQNEQFIVVDDKDRILEFRSRYDCHHDSSLLHRAVNIVLFNAAGEIALQKRSMLKDTNPGMFTVSATGHVAKGQSYDEASVRELEEELGIKTPLTFKEKYISRNSKESQMVSLYTGTFTGPFFPSRDEVEAIAFYSKEQIQALSDTITPIGKDALRHVGYL